MRYFNRILVALDFSEIDETVLQYTAGWCKHFGVEKIYFANVQRNLEVPEKFKSYLLEVNKPLDEKLRDDLEGRISAYFPDYEQYDFELDILEGNPRDQLSHWIKVKSIDLLITGRKAETHGRGILPQQLLRNSKSSILFVPQGKAFSLKTIGIPVKLGEQEDFHLKVAIDWVEEGGEIVVEHFYSIPSSYHHMVASTGMLLEGIKEGAEDELNNLLKEYNSTENKKKFTFTKLFESIVEYNLSEAIVKYSVQHNCDLVIMLSGGKSKIQAFLIGSETEAMVKMNEELPLLILKD